MRRIFHFLSSLRLTVTLLAFSMLLVFIATLEQVQWGIYEVQHRYFATLIAILPYPPQWFGAEYLGWLRIPLPGGFLLGALLVINLCCAHFRYFRASWRKTGIVLIHGGIVLLLISGFATAYFQQENFMWIDVGGSTNYIESFHDTELAFIDHTDPKEDVVVSIPTTLLKAGETISNPALPFTVKTKFYYPNSGFIMRSEHPEAAIPADHGVAALGLLGVEPIAYDYSDDSRNTAGAVVSLDTSTGPLGSWLVSTLFEPRTRPPFLAKNLPQTVNVNGHSWEICLRQRREYLPYSITLNKFTHEVYPGTDVPKNFSSEARLTNSATGEDRTVQIYMNHPLRYGGMTFYQASFAQGDNASMLQVVRNPGRDLPYISVLLVGVGMTIHFVMSLLTFVWRDKKREDTAPSTKTATATLPRTATIRQP